VVALCFLVAFVIAFLKVRYAQRVYEVNASIIIRETQETAEAEILYDNPLVNSYKNYFNELYIIRSYPLIQSVVEQQNFNVSFYKEGNILTTDAYHYVPVSARVISSEVNSGSFHITIKDTTSYTLRPVAPDDAATESHHFNDTVAVNGMTLVLQAYPHGERNINSYLGEEFLMTCAPSLHVAGSYVGRLDVTWAELGSSVVNLKINGANPDKEVDFLSALIDQYQQYNLDKKNQSATRSIEFIRGQLSSIRDSLRFFEVQLERFKNKNVVTDLNSEALRLFQKLENLESQKTEMFVRAKYYAYLGEYLNTNEEGALDKIVLPSSVGINDPVLTSLVTQLVDIQLQIRAFITPERSKNPGVISRRKEIAELVNNIIESTEILKSTDKIKSDQLNKEIRDIEKQLNYLPVAERQLVGIQRSYSLLENLYIFLMQKLSEAEISQASTTSDVVVVNPPKVGGKIAPKETQVYSIALALGLILPLGGFLLAEVLNTRIQSKEDVEKITLIPFIGGVGHNSADSNLIVQEKPKSSVSEAFRALRSNLNYFTSTQDKKIILVTSSISGEGKTFTSINLATVLAMSGKRTLIIGADMRKPKLYNDFGLHNDTGLSSYLSGLAGLDAIIQLTNIPNLSLLSGGPVPPNPSELLLKDDTEKLLNILKQDFDYIILDTPPVALVTDAFVLSRFADHTLFVVRQNYTPKMILRIIQDYYQSGRIRNISIVLNDIYKSGPGYGYGSGYGYGYGYGYSYSYGYGYGSKKDGGYYTE
jgi:capsular exopolysaccharide synthesis family protein